MQAFIAKLEQEGNRLQSLDSVLDRSTIERLLMEKPVDPYDRTPLTKEQLIPRELLLLG